MNICVGLGLLYVLYRVVHPLPVKAVDTQMVDLEAKQEKSIAPMVNPDEEKPIVVNSTNPDKPEEVVGENTNKLE
jgi:hypothetical protein